MSFNQCSKTHKNILAIRNESNAQTESENLIHQIGIFPIFLKVFLTFKRSTKSELKIIMFELIFVELEQL